MRVCFIEGCGRKHNAKGMCHMHYLQWRKATGQNISHRTPDGTELLTEADFTALGASVEADAQKLLPYAWRAIIKQTTKEAGANDLHQPTIPKVRTFHQDIRPHSSYL